MIEPQQKTLWGFSALLAALPEMTVILNNLLCDGKGKKKKRASPIVETVCIPV